MGEGDELVEDVFADGSVYARTRMPRVATVPNFRTVSPWSSPGAARGFAPDMHILERERARHRDLAEFDIGIQFFRKNALSCYSQVTGMIDRMRSLEAISQQKMTSFASRMHNSLGFFSECLGTLRCLIAGAFPKDSPHAEFAHEAASEFEMHLRRVCVFFEAHFGLRNAVASVSQLGQLRVHAGDLGGALAKVLGMLEMARERRLRPVVRVREGFFADQMARTLHESVRLAEIRTEMADMMSRRKRLDKGAAHLDKLFEVLQKLQQCAACDGDSDEA